MKKLVQIIFISIVLLGVKTIRPFQSHAQQFGLNTQYVFNLLSINPAYSGTQKALVASTMYRKQWAKIEGSPSAASFNMHTPFKKTNSAVGLQAYHDQVGAFLTSGAYINYAYHVRLTRRFSSSFGLRVGFDHFRNDFNSLEVTQDLNGQLDPLFTGVSNSNIVPNVGLGIYFSTKKYYLSISSPRILNSSFSNNDNVADELQNHFYLASGTIIDIKSQLKLKPNFMIRQVGNAPLSIDVGMYVMFVQNLWLGGAYRFNKTWATMINYEFFRDFKFGYSFDLPSKNLRTVTGTSHEVFLSYKLNKTPHYKNLVNPRSF